MWYESAREGDTHGGPGNSSLLLSAHLLKSLVLVSQISGGVSEKQPAGLRHHSLSQEEKGSLLHLLLVRKGCGWQPVKTARQNSEKEKVAERRN